MSILKRVVLVSLITLVLVLFYRWLDIPALVVASYALADRMVSKDV